MDAGTPTKEKNEVIFVKLREKITFYILLMLSMLVISSAAYAADLLPNPDRKGSVTVMMKDQGKPVAGGQLKLYQIADVKNDGVNLTFEYVSDFKDCREALTDLKREKIAENIASYAIKNELPYRSLEIDENGRAYADNLTIGLYLIAQDQPAKGYAPVNSFFVMIPVAEKNGLIYDVDATPKVGTLIPDSPKPTDTPAPTPTPTTPPGPLPQTGQVWWPLPFLILSGICFFILGCAMKRNKDS